MSFESIVERCLTFARIFLGMDEQHRRVFMNKVLDEATNGALFGRLLFNINLLNNYTRREQLYLRLGIAITRYYVIIRDNVTRNPNIRVQQDSVLMVMLNDIDKVTQKALEDQENGKDEDNVDR